MKQADWKKFLWFTTQGIYLRDRIIMKTFQGINQKDEETMDLCLLNHILMIWVDWFFQQSLMIQYFTEKGCGFIWSTPCTQNKEQWILSISTTHPKLFLIDLSRIVLSSPRRMLCFTESAMMIKTAENHQPSKTEQPKNILPEEIESALWFVLVGPLRWQWWALDIVPCVLYVCEWNHPYVATFTTGKTEWIISLVNSSIHQRNNANLIFNRWTFEHTLSISLTHSREH